MCGYQTGKLHKRRLRALSDSSHGKHSEGQHRRRDLHDEEANLLTCHALGVCVCKG